MATHTPIDSVEETFKALSDKTRLRILALLGSDEVCVCHLHDALDVPQPTVSRHLAYLRRTGLVTARREGVWMHYRVPASLDPVSRGIVDAALRALAHLPTTMKDRKAFQRSFGDRHVAQARNGGSCCPPRPEPKASSNESGS
jgi:ArsR family transcriptional regulator